MVIFVRRSQTDTVAIDDEEIDPEDMEEEYFLKTIPGLPPRFTYHELKKATNNFSLPDIPSEKSILMAGESKENGICIPYRHI